MTALLVEQCLVQHGYHGWTMLLNEQCCSLLFSWAILVNINETTTVVHGCWNRRSNWILIEQACSLLGIVIMAEQPCWQHWSGGAPQHSLHLVYYLPLYNSVTSVCVFIVCWSSQMASNHISGLVFCLFFLVQKIHQDLQ